MVSDSRKNNCSTAATRKKNQKKMEKHSRSAINYYYLCNVKMKVGRQRP
jgi:hypothetical protein